MHEDRGLVCSFRPCVFGMCEVDLQTHRPFKTANGIVRKFRLARTTAGKSYRGLSTGKEQPVRLLLVDQPVVIRDRLDADLLEDLAECIGER